MKKLISMILLSAVLTALLCVPLGAGAEPLPTSASVSGLSARFTMGGEGYGVLDIAADVTEVSDEEYFTVFVYTDVTDINDPSEGSNKNPLTFRTFKARNVVSDGALSITVDYLAEKLTGKCAVCVQIPNRGDNNDWVRAYIEAPLTAFDPQSGETETLWAPAGAGAAEWLRDNAGDAFACEGMMIAGWTAADGSDLGDAAIPLTGMTVNAEWQPVNGYLLGDMDFDGVHTVADALAALRISVKLHEPNKAEKVIADVDFDSAITVADALAILRIAARLAEPFDTYVFI